MKKSIIKKAIISVVCLGLVVFMAFASVSLRYYPDYREGRNAVSVDAVKNNGVTVMSCNLRYFNLFTDKGERNWFYRAGLIVDDIVSQAPGVIGFQEATQWQYNYLKDVLQGYDSVITYRDKMINSEGCPVFYNTSLYTLVDKGSFWLSETPEVMSKDWGSACYRICSYVILTDKATDKDFIVFNIHLDHVSDEARIKGIGVILDKIARFGSLPSVIMGDFNAAEGSETYTKVTENFIDAAYAATNSSGLVYTYHNWGNQERFVRIDYFMLSKTGFVVNRYEVLSSIHDGKYSSDHCPIVLNVTFE